MIYDAFLLEHLSDNALKKEHNKTDYANWAFVEMDRATRWIQFKR